MYSALQVGMGMVLKPQESTTNIYPMVIFKHKKTLL